MWTSLKITRADLSRPVPLARGLLVAASALSTLSLGCFQVQGEPGQSTLTVAGEDVGELEKALQHVSYVNARQFPTPGIRRLTVTTTVK